MSYATFILHLSIDRLTQEEVSDSLIRKKSEYSGLLFQEKLEKVKVPLPIKLHP